MAGAKIELDTSEIGSVGTLVGAALESAGHYLQSELLDVFASNLAGSLGALLYIMAALSAVLMIAMGGNYKYGLWFLVGPTLFYFLVGARVPSTGTHWHFGEQDRDQAAVQKAMRGVPDQNRKITTKSGKEVKVSWFFARWNQLTSSIVQNFVQLVNVTNDYRSLDFVGKVDRYGQTINAKASDAELIKYFQSIAATQCMAEFALKKDLYNPAISEARRTVVKKQLKILFENGDTDKRVFLSRGQWVDINDYLKRYFLDPSGGAIDSNKKAALEGGEVKIEYDDIQSGSYSCAQIWKLSVILFKYHAETLIVGIMDTRDGDDTPLRYAKAKLLEKYKYETRPPDDSMTQVTADDEMAYNYMVNEMAGRMILAELKNLKPGILQREKDAHALTREYGDVEFEEDREVAHLIGTLHGGVEYKAKGDFLTSMLAMPYLQGLALYLLSLSFPFFAMTMIVPGRQGGFLLWMGLWFWIKSWDFGFAVVMMIADMLYVLLPHGPPLTEEAMADPGLAFKQILSVDPTYGVYTYFQLVATSLAAVPMLTGVLVQKGGSEIIQAIDQGFKNFGGRVGHSMGQMERSVLAGDEGARTRKEIMSQMTEAGGNIIKNNPAISAAFARSLGFAASSAAAAQLSPVNIQAGISKVMLQGASDRSFESAVALYSQKLEEKAYEITNSEWVTKSGSRSVGLGMFSRHYGISYSKTADAMLKSIQVSVHPHINGKLDEEIMKGVHGGITSFGEVFKKGSGGVLGSGNTLGGILAGSAISLTHKDDALELAAKLEAAPDLSYSYGRSDKNIGATTVPPLKGHLGPIHVGAGRQEEGKPREDMARKLDSMSPGSRFNEPISSFESGSSRVNGEISEEGKKQIQSKLQEIIRDRKGWSAERKARLFTMIELRSGWNSSSASKVSSDSGLLGHNNNGWEEINKAMQASGIDQKIDGTIDPEAMNRGEFASRFDWEQVIKVGVFQIERNDLIAAANGVDLNNFDQALHASYGMLVDGPENYSTDRYQQVLQSDEAAEIKAKWLKEFKSQEQESANASR